MQIFKHIIPLTSHPEVDLDRDGSTNIVGGKALIQRLVSLDGPCENESTRPRLCGHSTVRTRGIERLFVHLPGISGNEYD